MLGFFTIMSVFQVWCDAFALRRVRIEFQLWIVHLTDWWGGQFKIRAHLVICLSVLLVFSIFYMTIYVIFHTDNWGNGHTWANSSSREFSSTCQDNDRLIAPDQGCSLFSSSTSHGFCGIYVSGLQPSNIKRDPMNSVQISSLWAAINPSPMCSGCYCHLLKQKKNGE